MVRRIHAVTSAEVGAVQGAASMAALNFSKRRVKAA
jgi:hypothetical protein